MDRNFTATRADQLCVTDITYMPTLAGFLYLAVVLDVLSRRIVGWSMVSVRACGGNLVSTWAGLKVGEADRKGRPRRNPRR